MRSDQDGGRPAMKSLMLVSIVRLRQGGISLIELMIGMTLGLIVLGAVLYVFSANQASYRHQGDLSRIQESGRYALEILTRDIRMAGYAGCGNIAYLAPVTNIVATPPDFRNSTAVFGAAATINVRGAVGAMSTLAGMTSTVLTLNAAHDFVVGERLLITDCAYAEIFEVSAESGLTVTATAALQRTFITGAQVFRYREVNYLLQNNVAGVSSLFSGGNEVVEGISAITFSYGVGAGPNRVVTDYVAAPADGRQVRSVRVDLTAFSPANPAVAQDFSTTIALRNKVP